jgi:hypothetical protein
LKQPKGLEMKYLHNIEKSAFRRFEYVGYANGAWRIRKGGCGGWEANKFVPMTRDIDWNIATLRGETLDAISHKLEAFSTNNAKHYIPASEG